MVRRSAGKAAEQHDSHIKRIQTDLILAGVPAPSRWLSNTDTQTGSRKLQTGMLEDGVEMDIDVRQSYIIWGGVLNSPIVPTAKHVRTGWDGITVADGSNDEPYPPPRGVRAVIPPFKTYGKHNCGSHAEAFRPNETDQKTSVCRDCGPLPGEARAMHVLPCGHRLCWLCLNLAVDEIATQINQNWSAIDGYLNERFWGSSRTNYAQDNPPSATQPHFNNALDEAGFCCCGKYMALGLFMPCLLPRVAMRLWLAQQLLSIPMEYGDPLRCGWPDCKMALPQTCMYLRNHEVRFYCVNCRGNSMVVSGMRSLPAA